MTSTTLDLLRHGAVDGELCLGSGLDLPVNPEGSRQMWERVPATPLWQGIVSSPLRRCAEFAGELAESQRLPLRLDADWRELGFGEWEGRSWAELYAREGERLSAFWRDPKGKAAPGGEVFCAFEQRVIGAWKRTLRQCRGQHWLIVTHAGPIRIVLRHVLGIPTRRLARLEVPLGCHSRLRSDAGESARLVFHGAAR